MVTTRAGWLRRDGQTVGPQQTGALGLSRRAGGKDGQCMSGVRRCWVNYSSVGLGGCRYGLGYGVA